MQKLLLLAVTCFLLSGCAGFSDQNKVSREKTAWQQLAVSVQKTCVKPGENLEAVLKSGDKPRALAILDCVDDLRNKIVAPAAAFPELYARMNAERIASKNVFASGKIDIMEFLIQANWRKQKYWKSVVTRGKNGGMHHESKLSSRDQ